MKFKVRPPPTEKREICCTCNYFKEQYYFTTFHLEYIWPLNQLLQVFSSLLLALLQLDSLIDAIPSKQKYPDGSHHVTVNIQQSDVLLKMGIWVTGKISHIKDLLRVICYSVTYLKDVFTLYNWKWNSCLQIFWMVSQSKIDVYQDGN